MTSSRRRGRRVPAGLVNLRGKVFNPRNVGDGRRPAVQKRSRCKRRRMIIDRLRHVPGGGGGSSVLGAVRQKLRRRGTRVGARVLRVPVVFDDVVVVVVRLFGAAVERTCAVDAAFTELLGAGPLMLMLVLAMGTVAFRRISDGYDPIVGGRMDVGRER